MNRLVTIETLYHQTIGEQPHSVDGGYGIALESSERPYLRTVTVSHEWQSLDLGWAKDPIVLLLKNEEGKFQRIPTSEERQVVDALVVEVSLGRDKASPEAVIEIPPGRSARITPSRNLEIQVRLRGDGSAKLTVAAYPR